MSDTTTFDPYSMSDADMDARADALGDVFSDVEEAPPAEDQTPDPVQEPDAAAADKPADKAEEQEGDEDDDPKNKVPVKEAQRLRQRAQQAEAERAEALKQASEARQQLETLNQQRENNRLQAQYDQLYEEQGYEAAERFRMGVVQQRTAEAQARTNADARIEQERLKAYEEAYRDARPDYDTQIAKVIERFGLDDARRMAARQGNPAKWAYELGKSLETPAERDAAIKAQVQKELKAALSKQQDPPPGRKSIGHLSSTRGSSSLDKALADMSDAEMDAHEASLRAQW